MSAAESGAEEAPAIAALGALFQLTEVFLWDDQVVSTSESSLRRIAPAEELTSSCTTTNAKSRVDHTIHCYTSPEDLELAQQMDALGLPISFSTNREKRNDTARGRRKGTRLKSVSSDNDIENRVHGVYRAGDSDDITSSVVFHDSTNLPASLTITKDQSVDSDHDLEIDHNTLDVFPDGDSIGVPAAVSTKTGEEQGCDEMGKETMPDIVNMGNSGQVSDYPVSLDVENYPENGDDADLRLHQEEDVSNKHEELIDLQHSCIAGHTSDGENAADTKAMQPHTNLVESSLSCTDHLQDCPENFVNGEYGDWRVVWDSFYMRNYFYNIQTQESTWFPPPGLEQLAFVCNKSDSVVFADETKEIADIGLACGGIKEHDRHSFEDKIGSIPEKEYSFAYKDQRVEEMSSRNNIAVKSVSECSHTCADGEMLLNEETPTGSSDIRNFMIDEVDDNYFDLQENNITSCDGWNNDDVSIAALRQSSSATTLDEVGHAENWTAVLPETCNTSKLDDLDIDLEIATSKKKHRLRRVQSQLITSEVTSGVSANTLKYWCQRYSLFSQFGNGIKMDAEGWFSVTPELIAKHHASRCGSGTIIDCFTGVGGNAIQFAARSNHVIAIDIDPQKIDYAQHNAAIYGVSERIDFINGDFFELAPCLKGDTVFLSPPWGGPDYAKVETYDITSMLKPHDGRYLFNMAKMIASRVVMFLPRNVNVSQLAELSLSADSSWALEVEKNYLNGRLKAVTAYFSRENT